LVGITIGDTDVAMRDINDRRRHDAVTLNAQLGLPAAADRRTGDAEQAVNLLAELAHP